MYSIRIVYSEDDLTSGPRQVLFCNRCGVIYTFIADAVDVEEIQHIVAGHRHYDWDSFGNNIGTPHFF